MSFSIYRLAAIVFLSFCSSLIGETVPSIQLFPSVLYAGSGPTQLRVFFARGDNSSLGLRWNGKEKPFTKDSFSSSYTINLDVQELASPGMAEVSLYDLKTGGTIASRFAFVGYNVVPNDIVYDTARLRFYLTTSTESKDPRFPANSLIAFDPVSLRIGPVLAIGAFPTNLSLTDDGASLYVAVDGEGLIRRVNLASFTVASEFRFRMNGGSSVYARSAIATMPGNPQTIAVYCHPNVNFSNTSVSIFDNGQKRPNSISSADGYNGILFAPDGKSVFLGSHGTFNTPQGVLRYLVDATGVPQQSPTTAPGGGPVTIQNNVLYTSRGTLIDIQKMQVVSTLGVSGPIVVDLLNQRLLTAYFTGNSNSQDYPQRLQAFDLSSQEPLGWIWLDAVYYFVAGQNAGERLMRFGTDGLLYTGSQALLLFRSPLAGPAPVTSSSAVVNSASQISNAIAPGEILTLYGTNLGPTVPLSAKPNTAAAYDAGLGNVQIWFDDKPGIVLAAANSQINVIAPFELRPGSTANLQVWNFGIPSARVPLAVAAVAPGIYTQSGTGKGPIAVINEDGSVNSPSRAGSYITLFGTGGGTYAGAIDGAIARGAQTLAQTVRVSIGGRDAPVTYAGAAPALPHGVIQINARIPADAASGIVPIIVSINGQPSAGGATIEIR